MDLFLGTSSGAPTKSRNVTRLALIDIEYDGNIFYSKDYLKNDVLPRKIVVGGDNDRPELLREACKNCNVLVYESTYTQEVASKVGEGKGHSWAALVASFAQETAIPNVVLTHFSARYQSNADKSPSIQDVREEAERIYKGNLFLAEDFAHYRLGRSGNFGLAKS